MIELNKVSKIFDTGFNQVSALSNVDVKIDQGEFVAIKGSSGSPTCSTLITPLCIVSVNKTIKVKLKEFLIAIFNLFAINTLKRMF